MASMLEEIDCLSMLNEKWCEEYMVIEKWKEKKEKLDNALNTMPSDRNYKPTL